MLVVPDGANSGSLSGGGSIEVLLKPSGMNTFLPMLIVPCLATWGKDKSEFSVFSSSASVPLSGSPTGIWVVGYRVAESINSVFFLEWKKGNCDLTLGLGFSVNLYISGCDSVMFNRAMFSESGGILNERVREGGRRKVMSIYFFQVEWENR